MESEGTTGIGPSDPTARSPTQTPERHVPRVAGPPARLVLIAIAFVIVARDPLGMLAARKPSWQWPRDASLPVVSAVASACVAAAWASGSEAQRRLAGAVRRAWPVLLIVAVSILSIRWSLSPQTTIADLQWLVASTVFAIGISVHVPLRRLIDALALALGSILAASAVLAQSPAYRSGTFWLGLYGNRNGLGAVAALSIPVFWYFGLGRSGSPAGTRLRRIAALVLSALSWACVLGTESRTSLGVAVVLAVGCAGLSLLRRRQVLSASGSRPAGSSSGRTRVLAAVGALAVGAALIARFASVAPVDRTLNMRTDMWRTLLPVANRQWAHGYGYGGFWSGARGYLLGAQFRSGAGPALATAHNGFLQEYLGTGVAGLLLAVALFGVLAFRLLPPLWHPDRSGPDRAERFRDNDFRLTMALGILLLNLTESMISSPLSLPWALLVVLLACPRGLRGDLEPVRRSSGAAVQRRSRSVRAAAPALIALAIVLIAARRPPYDRTLVADDFAAVLSEHRIADDPKTAEALNRLGLVYDRRRDLRLAFGLDDLRVRDLLEWSVTSDDSDAVGLSRYRPIFRRVIGEIDGRPAAPPAG